MLCYFVALPSITQFYNLQDTYDRVMANLELMQRLGFHFGAKIVRGAYMTMERNRAADMGYDDPIHNSYEDTCRMYDQVADTMLHLASRTPAEVMIASHNEDQSNLLFKGIFEKCIILCYSLKMKCSRALMNSDDIFAENSPLSLI